MGHTKYIDLVAKTDYTLVAGQTQNPLTHVRRGLPRLFVSALYHCHRLLKGQIISL